MKAGGKRKLVIPPELVRGQACGLAGWDAACDSWWEVQLVRLELWPWPPSAHTPPPSLGVRQPRRGRRHPPQCHAGASPAR